VASENLPIEAVDETAFDRCTSLAEVPPLDLFIRTGGDRRVSNFLLWQLAYAELYFTDTLWPDFNQVSLQHAINDFARRERRFGRTGDQVAQA
jgi:undecaprenyl diphosphate synthase